MAPDAVTPPAARKRRVVLVRHDPKWADEYSEESARIAATLGHVLVAIHHVGSTAITGITAKPVIDMLVEVEDVHLLDVHADRLGALGYEAMSEFGIPGRRYFRKNDAAGTRTHQIHAFAVGATEVHRHLAFRDSLRANPDQARRYEQRKHDLAARYPEDVQAYTDGKTDMIAELDALAAHWKEAGR